MSYKNYLRVWIFFCIIGIYLIHVKLQTKIDEIETKRIVTGHSQYNDDFSVKLFYKSEGYAGKIVSPRDVTLVTHCSTDKLYHLINLIESWDGAVSVSILASGDDAAFVDDAIDGLRACWPDIRPRMSFHVVYVEKNPHTANFTGLGSFTYNSCKDVMRKLYKRLPKISQDDTYLQYPHNMMRNIALMGAFTEYVLEIDGDLIPSDNLRSMFVNFLLKNNLFEPLLPESFVNKHLHPIEGVVFVLPVFEYKQYLGEDLKKTDLIKVINERRAKPLLKEVCKQCHKNTDYERWLKLDGMPDEISIGYDLDFEAAWEPFFISKRKESGFSEHFTKYGHDRLIQMCERKWRNTKFSVLDNAFLIREGFSYKNQMDPKKSARNLPEELHDEFRNEMRNIGINEIKVQNC